MINPDNVPAIDLDETVARYVLASKVSRLVFEDGGAKPQLFSPFKHVDLSVNRHLDCTQEEIWRFGNGVAEHQGKTLQGRFDISVNNCTIDRLKVEASPIKGHSSGVPDNPNHADVVGFPETKADQKVLALKLAEKAGKRIPPPSNDDSN